jgi:hypothetical protein
MYPWTKVASGEKYWLKLLYGSYNKVHIYQNIRHHSNKAAKKAAKAAKEE